MMLRSIKVRYASSGCYVLYLVAMRPITTPLLLAQYQFDIFAEEENSLRKFVVDGLGYYDGSGTSKEIALSRGKFRTFCSAHSSIGARGRRRNDWSRMRRR